MESFIIQVFIHVMMTWLQLEETSTTLSSTVNLLLSFFHFSFFFFTKNKKNNYLNIFETKKLLNSEIIFLDLVKYNCHFIIIIFWKDNFVAFEMSQLPGKFTFKMKILNMILDHSDKFSRVQVYQFNTKKK